MVQQSHQRSRGLVQKRAGPAQEPKIKPNRSWTGLDSFEEFKRNFVVRVMSTTKSTPKQPQRRQQQREENSGRGNRGFPSSRTTLAQPKNATAGKGSRTNPSKSKRYAINASVEWNQSATAKDESCDSQVSNDKKPYFINGEGLVDINGDSWSEQDRNKLVWFKKLGEGIEPKDYAERKILADPATYIPYDFPLLYRRGRHFMRENQFVWWLAYTPVEELEPEDFYRYQRIAADERTDLTGDCNVRKEWNHDELPEWKYYQIKKLADEGMAIDTPGAKMSQAIANFFERKHEWHTEEKIGWDTCDGWYSEGNGLSKYRVLSWRDNIVQSADPEIMHDPPTDQWQAVGEGRPRSESIGGSYVESQHAPRPVSPDHYCYTGSSWVDDDDD